MLHAAQLRSFDERADDHQASACLAGAAICATEGAKAIRTNSRTGWRTVINAAKKIFQHLRRGWLWSKSWLAGDISSAPVEAGPGGGPMQGTAQIAISVSADFAHTPLRAAAVAA